jgi:hypothetical protein
MDVVVENEERMAGLEKQLAVVRRSVRCLFSLSQARYHLCSSGWSPSRAAAARAVMKE